MKKIFFAATFFSVLCNVFLNTICWTQDAVPKDKKFIQPLIIATYSNGTAFTEFGGMTGGDENEPGTLYVAVEHDGSRTLGGAGYSIRLEYDVENLGEFTFYWIKLGKELSGTSSATAALDLSEYDYLSFWVRGEQEMGNIKIELHQDSDDNGVFTFGKDITSYVYINAYIKGGMVGLEWRKVTIPFKAFQKITDWSKMLELVFVVENKSGDKKGVFYLDDIMFGYRPEDILFAPEDMLKAMAEPVASTFKIDGLSSEQCLIFRGTNQLSIDAEDVYENPFIDGVRFEYSQDGGVTWKAIGTDYDVSKKTYRVDWEPNASRPVRDYQVRAMAVDIRGNEKPTTTLISCGVQQLTDDEFLNLIEKKAFEFFRDHQDPKTGLFADTSGGGDASIASTGLGLAALCIGAERGWITKEEARQRVNLALDTFLPAAGQEEPVAEGRYGFFYHFLNKHTGKRAGKSEISTVDTAILVCG
ncbi:MAG: hypothetical protein NC933_06090, partial [Candidatus Omnitrophica bacterium]|nr:hypothetical protein [Candidatus Omnitrophota bacterium]